MINKYITQWENNKYILENWFRNLDDTYLSYEGIVRKLFESVIVEFDDYSRFAHENMVVLDHGDYQGTTIYIVPANTYQPSVDDYVFTHNYYGSCSGCDTLLSIVDFTDGKFDEEQISDLMTLSLHLVQNIQPLTNNN